MASGNNSTACESKHSTLWPSDHHEVLDGHVLNDRPWELLLCPNLDASASAVSLQRLLLESGKDSL